MRDEDWILTARVKGLVPFREVLDDLSLELYGALSFCLALNFRADAKILELLKYTGS